MEQPDRKVTTGMIAGAFLGTALWIAKLVLGKPVPITADEAVYAMTVIVFVLQYWTRNRQPNA